MTRSRPRPARAVPSLIAFAAHIGVSPLELLRSADIDPARVRNPDTDVPLPLRMRLWDEAVRLSGDPDFGLHMAEWVCRSPEQHFDVLAYAVRSCATLGEHYRRVARYVRLIYAGMFLSLELNDDIARLVHGLTDGTPAPRQPMECMLAMAVLQGRTAVGDDLAPREVRFSHPAPERVDEHERLFRAPVRFGCPDNELWFERADLDRPQRHAEPGLQAVLERQLDELLSQVPETQSFSSQVTRCMADLLLDGPPAVGAVAARLHMSARTLQRRLGDEGTSFARLLTDLRRDLALRHLQDPRRTISEVTFLLGFAEVSAFHRAFKRWNGTTPAEYQRMAQQAYHPQLL